MTTHQFFIKQSQIDENRIVTISGPDARHMARVLRLKKRNQVKLVDEKQRLYTCLVERVDRESVLLSIKETIDCSAEQTRVSVVQGIPRLPKTDLIVQKLTELGLGKVTFVPMERSPYRDAFERMQTRLPRLNQIAEAAAKQCGRRCIPYITAVESLEKAVGDQKTGTVALVANERWSGGENLRKILSTVASASPVVIFVGPEGGFTDEELRVLDSAGAISFSLGRNILRTETAAIVAAAIVLYELEEI
jgi:16S rRNA (uracil1498-N3)-methyltransferase